MGKVIVLNRSKSALISSIDETPFNTISARILQIGVGFYLILRVFVEFPVAEFIYGNSGIQDKSMSEILGHSQVTDWFDRWFHQSPHYYSLHIVWILAAIALISGRWVFPAGLLTSLSLYASTQLVSLNDGGDNIARFFALYSAFFVVNKNRLQFPRIQTLFHNLAIIACFAQLCLIYIDASFGKLEGVYWRNGTALYYIMNSDAFGTGVAWVADAFKNPFVVTISTYSTLIYQVSFPFLIFTRIRPYCVLVGVLLHTFIAIAMGLLSFGFIMICVVLIVLSDRDWTLYQTALYRFSGRWSGALGRH